MDSVFRTSAHYDGKPLALCNKDALIDIIFKLTNHIVEINQHMQRMDTSAARRLYRHKSALMTNPKQKEE